MIPLKSMVQGQRSVMAARMLTQALPLINAEAPTPELVAEVVSGGYASMSDWFFQMVFVATAASIVSGAVAERIKVWPFMIFVILLTGVNGAGKTTTAGKLASHFINQGYSVMLAAGDTFRAAAVEQLQTWGERNNVPVIAQHKGADSAAVIFDALQSARANNIDILIADTAGRLHTQDNLMDELKKIHRAISKFDDALLIENILVLDAATGQNALSQAKLFNQAIGIDGIVLTKLDGTAKGGVIFALALDTGIPIRFIGVGEQLDDLHTFESTAFVEALLEY
jgi:fused signal recognition particle receptor